MKNHYKVLISVLALGVMAASPLLRAEEEKAPASETPKGGRGGRDGGRGGRGGTMASADERVAAIDKAVGGLTEDQKTKIKEIFTKSQDQMREQMQAARSGGGGDRGAMRTKMEEMMKATHDQVRALLTTDEQKKKFDDMPAPPRGGPGGPGGGKGGRKKSN